MLKKETVIIKYIKKNYFQIIEEIIEQNDFIAHLKKDKNYNEKNNQRFTTKFK
jgi:hypothetical protein